METNEQLLVDALARLVLEAMHYRNTGRGKPHLNAAIYQAEDALIAVRKASNRLASGEAAHTVN